VPLSTAAVFIVNHNCPLFVFSATSEKNFRVANLRKNTWRL